jgi:hypothetical protein
MVEIVPWDGKIEFEPIAEQDDESLMAPLENPHQQTSTQV